MKKLFLLIMGISIILTSCNLPTTVSDTDIATAIAQTQDAQIQIAAKIETGIAQTLAAAITNTPLATNTPLPTETPVFTNTPEPTITPTITNTPYFSPTPTLNLIITLRTKNQCDVPVTVTGVGPMSFTFTLGKDEIDQRKLVPGTYVFSDSKGHKWEQGFSTAGTYSWVLCRNK